jgi:hypothetical protein
MREDAGRPSSALARTGRSAEENEGGEMAMGAPSTESRAGWRLARALARADRRGALAEPLEHARLRLRAEGMSSDEAHDEALLLLALGLREGGADHARVVERLHPHGAAAAARAALESARIVRSTRPDLDPERLAAFRRRAAVAIFLAFAAWGALGVHLLERLG